MSLADSLAQPVHNKGGRICPLCDLLPTLPDDEREALDRALARDAHSGGWSARAITDALHQEGHTQVAKSTVENHRREHMA